MAPKEKASQQQPALRPADSPHPALKLRHTLRGHTDNVLQDGPVARRPHPGVAVG